jgi:hypothetical protein
VVHPPNEVGVLSARASLYFARLTRETRMLLYCVAALTPTAEVALARSNVQIEKLFCVIFERYFAWPTYGSFNDSRCIIPRKVHRATL